MSSSTGYSGWSFSHAPDHKEVLYRQGVTTTAKKAVPCGVLRPGVPTDRWAASPAKGLFEAGNDELEITDEDLRCLGLIPSLKKLNMLGNSKITKEAPKSFPHLKLTSLKMGNDY